MRATLTSDVRCQCGNVMIVVGTRERERWVECPNSGCDEYRRPYSPPVVTLKLVAKS